MAITNEFKELYKINRRIITIIKTAVAKIQTFCEYFIENARKS